MGILKSSSHKITVLASFLLSTNCGTLFQSFHLSMPYFSDLSSQMIGSDQLSFKLYCASESPGRLVKTQLSGPNLRISVSKNLRGGQKYAFLTRSQGLLLVESPHFENHQIRCSLRSFQTHKYYILVIQLHFKKLSQLQLFISTSSLPIIN